MRTLWLLRHAKSSWAESVPDHDRPLARRGSRAARMMAEHLVAAGVRPTLVLCSSAARTRATLDALRPALHRSVVSVEPALYGADSAEILDRLRRVEPDVESVMVIGHNPGLQDLAIELAGNGERATLDRLHAKFPTGALATLDLGETSWSVLGAGQTSLTDLMVPKQLT